MTVNMQEIQKFEPGKGIWLCRQKMTFFMLNDWHEAMEGLRNFIALVSWVPIRQLWVWNHKCIGTYSFLDSLVGVLQITFNHVVFTARDFMEFIEGGQNSANTDKSMQSHCEQSLCRIKRRITLQNHSVKSRYRITLKNHCSEFCWLNKLVWLLG